jgi:hypothetical protein
MSAARRQNRLAKFPTALALRRRFRRAAGIPGFPREGAGAPGLACRATGGSCRMPNATS